MDHVSVSSARQAAYLALSACEKQGAWSDQAIRTAARRCALSPRDAALASNLCYGVVQNQLLLDFWINTFSKIPLHKLEPAVVISLRLGLYQLHFLDRIPASAAVNESVNLVRLYGKNKKGASGLTNGVLRSFQRTQPAPLPRDADPLKALSLRYSHPYDLVCLLYHELHEDLNSLTQLLELNNTPVSLVIQRNPLKGSLAQLTEALEKGGAEVQAHPWFEDCLLLRKSGDLEQLPLFQEGRFYVQDCAAKLAAWIAQPGEGDRLLDVCAAPGGKSFACALAMGDRGEILSCDIHPNKLKRIRDGASRLGVSCIQTQAQDARQYRPEWDGRFDVVLADVPCSGLGIIRKKPDIRYKNLADTLALPDIQLDILSNVARYVKPGGTLVYSTCTVLQRENQQVVARFLAQAADFSLAPFTLPEPLGVQPGQITLWPHLHQTDGFFMAKLRRAYD